MKELAPLELKVDSSQKVVSADEITVFGISKYEDKCFKQIMFKCGRQVNDQSLCFSGHRTAP